MQQITIYDLLPLLEKGWVAMDKSGFWYWYEFMPKKRGCMWYSPSGYEYNIVGLCYGFKKLAPFDGDWKDSLIKIEPKDEE